MPVPASSPLLKARISIPPVRAQVVARPRLVTRIDEAVTRRFALITAPAGFGKTTLLTQWIASVAGTTRVAWLSLDEADRDPMHFLRYLVAAFAELEPHVTRATGPLIGSLRVPAPKDLMTLLLSEIGEPAHDTVLVLDDYQVVDDAEINAAVAFFIDRMPARLRLVVASREEPRLPLARWRSLEILSEIGVEDLRFSLEE